MPYRNSSGSIGIPWDLQEYSVIGRLGIPCRNSSGSVRSTLGSIEILGNWEAGNALEE